MNIYEKKTTKSLYGVIHKIPICNINYLKINKTRFYLR